MRESCGQCGERIYETIFGYVHERPQDGHGPVGKPKSNPQEVWSEESTYGTYVVTADARDLFE